MYVVLKNDNSDLSVMEKVYKTMKNTILAIFILLIITDLNEIKGQNNTQNYGTIKVLYIHRLKEQLLKPFPESELWKIRTFRHTCMNLEVREIREQLTQFSKDNQSFTLNLLLGLRPPKERTCTRFFYGYGKKHVCKIHAETDKVFAAVERKKKQLAFIIINENDYVIQYFEGDDFKLMFEIVVGKDFIIGLFHDDEKIYWTGNYKNISAHKGWKLYNPEGMYPFIKTEVGYFKVKTRLHFD